jgi:hypothetical protein
VNKDTLDSLLSLFELLLDITQEFEYQYFVTPEELTADEKKEAGDEETPVNKESTPKPKNTDVQLIKAYQRLKIDYSNPLTPLSLRNHYRSAIKTEDRPEKLRKLRESYFVILRILPLGKQP